jgi:hypothetical protein
MLRALFFTYISRLSAHRTALSRELWILAGFAAVEVTLFIAAWDTLNKYYIISELLLMTEEVKVNLIIR